ncbi:WecB/TagA/CpsF family glycosyltransferase [Serinicoccus marinus]|uniref:WecB/TagA/CpsF family glycosyltransferase n=1 Tax=Serinicoccus marinus TaxID=247333 RepID=UPI0009FBF793
MQAAIPATHGARLIYALHVGGLDSLSDPAFRRALEEADLVYADGAAVVLLARIAGSGSITRSATTDIGIPVIRELGRQLARTPRVAMVGGQIQTTNKAADALRAQVDCEVVLVENGYFDDDADLLERVNSVKPDIVVVGLGMPKEALWTHSRREDLPTALILTCGGWFGFLAGEEPRAPQLLRRTGMEWSYRLAHDFPRLRRRYAVGAWLTLRNIPRQLRERRS